MQNRTTDSATGHKATTGVPPKNPGIRGSSARWSRFGLLLGLLTMAAGKGLSQGNAGSSCERCHSRIAVEYRDSNHAKAGLTCTRCHGGDPSDMTEGAMSPKKGFRGKVSRQDVPAFCASCHERSDMMSPYGLPTDQAREYRTSKHGQRLAAGDTKVAVCTDCHEKHRIVSAKDPLSSVAKTKVPATCGRCHVNAALMAKYDLPSNQFDEYKQSVHGQALLVGQNKAAPNCASCHGNHGAKPPLTRVTDDVCGQCHANTEEAFFKSPHKPATDAGKMRPCVGCHGNHRILRPTPSMLPTICGNCHKPSSAAFGLGRELLASVTKAQESLDRGQRTLKRARKDGFEVGGLESQIAEARTSLLQMAVEQHSLLKREVERSEVAVEAIANDIVSEIRGKYETRRMRKLIVIPFWGYVFLSLAFLYLKRQRVEGARRRAERLLLRDH